MKNNTNDNRPYVGQTTRVFGVLCRVVRVYPMGTIDVEALDDSGRAWRVSGLAFINR